MSVIDLTLSVIDLTLSVIDLTVSVIDLTVSVIDLTLSVIDLTLSVIDLTLICWISECIKPLIMLQNLWLHESLLDNNLLCYLENRKP